MSNAERAYPQHADIVLAAQEGSNRYYFADPVGGCMSVPAMNAEQARQLAADEYRGFGPEDFEQVDGFDDYEPFDYPTPVESGRPVNEYDLWTLRHAFRIGGRIRKKLSSRRNPTERILRAVIDEWDDPDDVPLADVEALQQADGIGPSCASRIVGAALAAELIERPARHE